jgi:hypothetical protein
LEGREGTGIKTGPTAQEEEIEKGLTDLVGFLAVPPPPEDVFARRKRGRGDHLVDNLHR